MLTAVAVIPARGGSKGLPGKNLACVRGRSLVARAVDAARDVPIIGSVVVTTDNERIASEATSLGADVIERPADLATDTATTVAAVRHVLETFSTPPEQVVVLQPTSPLRQPSDVRACLAALGAARTATTVCPVDHPTAWSFHRDEKGHLHPLGEWATLPRQRQEAAAEVRLNGAVYAARSMHLLAGGDLVDEETFAVMMSRERSIDIDTELDLVIAEAVAGWLEGGA